MTALDETVPPTVQEGPVTLDLEYSSAGAFLVAYSTDLAKGGMFVETPNPLPVGIGVILRFHVPGADLLEIQGQVAWGREEAVGPGMPAGMAIEIVTPPDEYGVMIDRVAFGFSGINILLGTGEPAPRAILTRYLRSILTCEVTDVDFEKSFDVLPAMIDLAIVDLDSSGVRGDELIQHLRTRVGSALPVVVLAQLERDRVRAQELGANDAVSNPPLFAELSATIVRCIGRPNNVVFGS